MTNIALDDHALDGLARARFDWPEALLIDLIGEAYGAPPAAAERMVAARLHVRFLRVLLDGDDRASATLRLDLIACCAARGIERAAIEAADHAAFREMMAMVKTRFRNSPRHQLAFLQRLHDALGRLPGRPAPAPTRPPLLLRRNVPSRTALVAA